MTCKEIIAEYLKKNGYDGLFNGDIECGCESTDLMPCCEAFDGCEPGYKVICEEGSEYDWLICKGEPKTKERDDAR